MGGSIRAESALGEGSRFLVELPLPAAETQPDRRLEWGGRRVLVSCASPVVAATLANQIEALGLAVQAASDLADAERLAQQSRPDLLVADPTDVVDASRQSAPGLSRLRVVPVGGPRGMTSYDSGDLPYPVRSVTLLRRLRALLLGVDDAPTDTAPISFSEQRVLLVEDNPINQLVGMRMLQHLGVRADLAADGVEARRAIRRKPYDLVLIDLHMPRMDGLSLAQSLRADLPPEKTPRLVAMTASALASDRLACREAGMDGLVAKPVRLEELRALLASGVATEKSPPPTVRDSFDPRFVDQLRQLEQVQGETLVEPLVRSFGTQSRSRLEAICQALEEGDAQALCRAAHALMGSAAQLGARRVAELAATLEAAAERRELEAAERIFEELTASLDEAVAILRSIAAEGASGRG